MVQDVPNVPGGRLTPRFLNVSTHIHSPTPRPASVRAYLSGSACDALSLDGVCLVVFELTRNVRYRCACLAPDVDSVPALQLHVQSAMKKGGWQGGQLVKLSRSCSSLTVLCICADLRTV